MYAYEFTTLTSVAVQLFGKEFTYDTDVSDEQSLDFHVLQVDSLVPLTNRQDKTQVKYYRDICYSFLAKFWLNLDFIFFV